MAPPLFFLIFFPLLCFLAGRDQKATHTPLTPVTNQCKAPHCHCKGGVPGPPGLAAAQCKGTLQHRGRTQASSCTLHGQRLLSRPCCTRCGPRAAAAPAARARPARVCPQFNATTTSQQDYQLDIPAEVAHINITAARLAKRCTADFMAAHPGDRRCLRPLPAGASSPCHLRCPCAACWWA